MNLSGSTGRSWLRSCFRLVSLGVSLLLLTTLLVVVASTVAPRTAEATTASPVVVSVGYADSLRANGFFPTPWYGSPGVIFEGCSPPSACTFDGGAIEVVNTSGSAQTINAVTAQFSTCTFNLWPANVSLPAGGTAIYAQTIGGPSGGCQTNGSFDSSDVGPNGSVWTSCTNSGVIPQVNVTVNGTPQSLTDSAQILNTAGIDKANCPSGSNESTPWTELTPILTPSNLLGGQNASAPQIKTCNQGTRPVTCATGNFWHTFDELSIPGRGPALDLSLTYNSLAAAGSSPIGFGWSFTYGMQLVIDPTTGNATVVQENGATVPFSASSGSFQAPSFAAVSLVHNPDGSYTFTRRHGGYRFAFSPAGQLTSITDRNGYATTLAYNQAGQLATVTDPAGRALAFTYGSNADIATVTDPGGRTVAFGYDSGGDLTSITDVIAGVTSFAYDAAHRVTTMTDPRGGVTTNTYDANSRVTAQTDALGRTTSFSYSAGTTTITDPVGNVTLEHFSDYVPVAVTRGSGTASEATWKNTYDPATVAMLSATDPDGHVSTFRSDADGNTTGEVDALGRSTSASYNAFDEPTAVTDANGVTSSYAYDAAGNLQSVSRPLTSTGQVQTVTFTYGDASHPGDVTAMTDPDQRVWTYGYDANGDRASSTDPLGDKTTSAYDAIGRMTSTVSPRGDLAGANPAAFTTSFAYDAFGDLIQSTDPLGHITRATYDAIRNQTSTTDADGHVTTYAYDADNEATGVTRADGTTLGSGYDADGNRIAQTDALGHRTSYAYDALNRVIATTDPDNRTTSYGYDLAGNRTSLTDPAGNLTTYGYDADNEATSTTYSDGSTPDVSYTYTALGQRQAMTDGTGTSSYSYDSLGRLTAQTNGAGQSVGYGYDLANRLIALTYPNAKTVTRTYDAAGRLTAVTDWAGHTTAFSPDADANVTATVSPNGVTAASSFDNADQLATISDTLGSSTLASFAYTRDPVGQLASSTPTGVGQGAQSYSYTALNQIQGVNAASYGYDAAGNLTNLINATTQSFDPASQLTSATPAGGSPVSFTYDARGNRLSGVTPGGSGVTYTYDQANRLSTAVAPATSASGLLAGGEYHSLAVTSSGAVWAWGYNAYGQLGNGSTTGSTTPVSVSGIPAASAVAAGDLNSAALVSGGAVMAWGYNAYGQLGNSTTTGSTTPVSVTGLSGERAIAAGNYHMLAVNPDGTVSAWGLNNAGQLGDGTTTNRDSPVSVAGLSSVVAVAAGGLPGYAGQSVALRSDGSVWTWGYGKSGQLGLGSDTSTPTPSQVPGLAGVKAIAANGDDTYALRSDGTVWAWGSNAYGQMGNTAAGHTQDTPIQVSITAVASIAAGGTHALAVRTDGTAWAWGDNNTGQLGDGGACGKTCTTPVQVSGLTGVTTLAGGYVHSLAALSGGTVAAWGRNAEGELGDGTTAASLTPVATSGLSSVKPAPAVNAAYGYDGDGLRASRTTGGTTQHFAWDLSGGQPLMLADGTMSYLYDDNGLPIEQIDASGTRLYYQHDQLGSTRLLTTSTGSVAATYSYDPYGNLTARSGTSDTPLRFAGQYTDAESGLIYLRARYYDPATGQFMSRDPLVALTGQAYGYVGDNPLNAKDPSGLCGPLPNGVAGPYAPCLPGPPTGPGDYFHHPSSASQPCPSTPSRSGPGTTAGAPMFGPGPPNLPTPVAGPSPPPGPSTVSVLGSIGLNASACVSGAAQAEDNAGQDLAFVGGVFVITQFIPGVDLAVDAVAGIGFVANAAYGCGAALVGAP